MYVKNHNQQVSEMNEKNIGYPASLLDLLDELEQKGATAAEKATAMERYIEYKARINGVPMRGTLELTPLCNLDCKMCYVHLNKNQLANDCGSILSGKQWISIIEQAIENGLTPNGSELDVSEIYSSTVIKGAIEDLGLNCSVDEVRSHVKVTPIIPEEEAGKQQTAIDKGEEYEYFPTDYVITYEADS